MEHFNPGRPYRLLTFLRSYLLSFLTLGLVLGTLTSARQSSYAWYLTATFEPEGSDVEGLSVAEIDSAWLAATALNEAILPDQAFVRGESVQENGMAFEISRDFDGDGRTDKALVGVYRTADEVGRFLLILTADMEGSWSKHALFKTPGRAGFSVLFEREGQLHWASCMACDSGCAVVTARTPWELECYSCC